MTDITKRVSRKSPPARSPEARENQLIAKAVDLAERQLSEGTASAQVITHFLKLATTREKLEKAKIEKEMALLDAKAKSLENAQTADELYGKALDAMRRYSGSASQDVTNEDV